MVFQKGHKPYNKKNREDENMFGLGKKEEKVKTFVDGHQMGQDMANLPPPPMAPAQPGQYVGKGRYAEANMQLPYLPMVLLLKLEVAGDIIPILLRIDKNGIVTKGD